MGRIIKTDVTVAIVTLVTVNVGRETNILEERCVMWGWRSPKGKGQFWWKSARQA